MTEWININDRKPENNDKILIGTADGSIMIGHYDTKEDLFLYYDPVIDYDYEPCYVTHWMPIPDLSSETEN